MKFCPNCGGILVPVPGKKRFYCRVCGKGYNVEEKFVPVANIKKERKVFMIGEEKDKHPKTKIECPRCGNNEAYWWVKQTRASDEAPTKFYKCTKCEYIWREYS